MFHLLRLTEFREGWKSLYTLNLVEKKGRWHPVVIESPMLHALHAILKSKFEGLPRYIYHQHLQAELEVSTENCQKSTILNNTSLFQAT
jgi:hypothetical protein